MSITGLEIMARFQTFPFVGLFVLFSRLVALPAGGRRPPALPVKMWIMGKQHVAKMKNACNGPGGLVGEEFH